MQNFIRTLAAVLALVLAAPVASHAAAGDYAFEAVQEKVVGGQGKELAVRLINKRTGKPIAGAVIFRTRLDMSPSGMEAMTSKIEPVANSEPGIYKFRGDLTMAGQWALKLQAKVQGEPETVSGTVVFTATD